MTDLLQGIRLQFNPNRRPLGLHPKDRSLEFLQAGVRRQVISFP